MDCSSIVLYGVLNEKVTEGIIRYILECFPDAASAAFNNRCTSLHVACWNKNVTLNLNIVQLLIDDAPNSILTASNVGLLTLHHFQNKNVDEKYQQRKF
jgi:hypothetical protein